MSVTKRNVAANFGAKAWAALMSLSIVPFYLKFLGIEAYGLIGFFLTLAAVFSVFDFGLGTALNRRLAQFSTQSGAAQEMRDLLRTLEAVYWLIGIAIAAVIIALAPLIAAYWVQSKQISATSVARAVALMGAAVACQWPLALYGGGVMGMEKQVAGSALSCAMITLRSVGAVVVAWKIPSIQAFFAWQIAISLVETSCMRALLWRCLPNAPRRPQFRLDLLSGLWRFAAGLTGISVMSIVLTQLDKVILSKVLSLEAFGYYSLAWRAAGSLYYLAGPVNSAIFPRFSRLAVGVDICELVRLYHGACQLLSVLVLPVALMLALFAHEFLLLWTHNAAIAANCATLLSLLTTGTAINALVTLPLTLQLAHGWTRLVFMLNTVSVVLLAPLIYLMSTRYGGIGAAWIWIALNCGYVIFMLRIMHRRLLPQELRKWFLIDTGLPLAAALAVAGFCKMSVDFGDSYLWTLFKLSGVSLATFAAAAYAAPQLRVEINRYLSRSQGRI